MTMQNVPGDATYRDVVARLVTYEDDRYEWIYNMGEIPEHLRLPQGEALDAEYAAIVKLARELLSREDAVKST